MKRAMLRLVVVIGGTIALIGTAIPASAQELYITAAACRAGGGLVTSSVCVGGIGDGRYIKG